MFDEVVDGGAESKYYMEDPRDPNKLFGEHSSQGEICPGDNKSDTEDEGEEDNSICI